VIRKKKRRKQKEVSIFIWWSNGAVTYLAKAALEANDFDVTITNLAPGMIFGELSKTTQRGCFLMPGFNSHKDYWADYGENLVVIGEAFSDATTGLVVLPMLRSTL
jgi:glycine betaine/proline transport system substrate-binding protein